VRENERERKRVTSTETIDSSGWLSGRFPRKLNQVAPSNNVPFPVPRHLRAITCPPLCCLDQSGLMTMILQKTGFLRQGGRVRSKGRTEAYICEATSGRQNDLCQAPRTYGRTGGLKTRIHQNKPFPPRVARRFRPKRYYHHRPSKITEEKRRTDGHLPDYANLHFY
jgi:hypothetical protein